MANGQDERKLTAILAADVVDFSGLIEVDESGTRAALRDELDHIANQPPRTSLGRSNLLLWRVRRAFRFRFFQLFRVRRTLVTAAASNSELAVQPTLSHPAS